MIRIISLFIFVLFFSLVSCSEEDSVSSNYNPPKDHTVNKDGIRHKPGLKSPLENCVNCHGSDLHGGASAPSCYECHGKKWS